MTAPPLPLADCGPFRALLCGIPPAQRGGADAYDAQARNRDKLDPTLTPLQSRDTERGLSPES